MVRKVRDYDAELKALNDKAKALKARKVEQLGALVAATGADALDLDVLAGVLLDAAGSQDTDAKEAWRTKGAAFFQRRGRKGRKPAQGDSGTGTAQPDGDAAGAGGASTLI